MNPLVARIWLFPIREIQSSQKRAQDLVSLSGFELTYYQEANLTDNCNLSQFCRSPCCHVYIVFRVRQFWFMAVTSLRLLRSTPTLYQNCMSYENTLNIREQLVITERRKAGMVVIHQKYLCSCQLSQAFIFCPRKNYKCAAQHRTSAPEVSTKFVQTR